MSDTAIPWFKSLRFVLLLLNLVLALLFGAAAFMLNQQALEAPLTANSEAISELQQRQLADQLRGQAATIESFSLAFNALSASLWTQDNNLRGLGERLLAQIPADSAIVAAGIWPEPRKFNNRRDRYSFYWTLNQGSVSFHGDYNDPANISYHGERWYTPARYLTAPGCFWSGRFNEPFLKRQVIACSNPIRNSKGTFLGVTTLVIDPERLQANLAQRDHAQAYFLLLDHEQRVLKSAGLGTEPGETLPSLAQRDERFGRIAVALHSAAEKQQSQASAGVDDWQSRVETLSQQTRELSKLEAAQLLARINAHNEFQLSAAKLSSSDLQSDTIGGMAILLSGQSQVPKIAGFALSFWLSAATTAGAIALALLLSALLSSRSVVTPLRRILNQLKQPAEDTQLDESAASEFGALANQLNQRHERIRMLLASTRRSTQAPVASVASKRDSEGHGDQDGWAVVDALSDAVVLTDQAAKISYMNSAAEALSGGSLAKADGLVFDEVFAIFDRHGKQRIKDLALRAIQAGRRSERPLQAVFKTRGGHNLPMAVSSAPILDDKGQIDGAVIILHDNRQAQGALPSAGAPQDRSDKLTGALNRLAFDAEFASRVEAVRMGGEAGFALLYIDVDHMQEINDAFGNDGGDEFLRQLARLIQSDVSDSTPLYRLHGDKFVVMLNTDDDAEAQVTAELLRADVQSWGFQWKGETRDVSVSLGLVNVDKDSGRAIDILRLADELCQQAQSEGRGRIASTRAQATKNERRDDRAWLNIIKQGLSQDRFHLSTQQIKPLQRKADEGLIFDTMLLLEDEEGFWTGSQTFMPIAERNNLAEQLDRWTIEHIFQRLTEDKELIEQLDCCIVSLSSSTLQSPSFLDFMFENFKQGGVAPGKICLNLDEKDIHARLSAAREFCQTMTRAGCRISVSNVSTRPSSYKLIKQLPIDFVRFDPLLTKHADSDPVDRLAAESLHRIVHTLGRQGMATQVNSPELLRILQGIGIHYAQGDAVARHSPILFHAQT